MSLLPDRDKDGDPEAFRERLKLHGAFTRIIMHAYTEDELENLEVFWSDPGEERWPKP